MAIEMKMPTNSEILLACGEMTAGELRAVKAALQWFISTQPEAVLIDGLTGRQWEERAKYLERIHSELRAFVDAAFQAHPNLDIDAAAYLPQPGKS